MARPQRLRSWVSTTPYGGQSLRVLHPPEEHRILSPLSGPSFAPQPPLELRPAVSAGLDGILPHKASASTGRPRSGATISTRHKHTKSFPETDPTRKQLNAHFTGHGPGRPTTLNVLQGGPIESLLVNAKIVLMQC